MVNVGCMVNTWHSYATQDNSQCPLKVVNKLKGMEMDDDSALKFPVVFVRDNE